MRNKQLLHTVMAALFAALVCVATVAVRVPIPATQGYANLGDALVLLAAFFLGPLYGALAAGVGSALADLFAGYALYAPGTAVIKGLCAMTAAGLEPKRLRLVQPREGEKPNLFLVEGRRGGKPGLEILPPLPLAAADGTDSAEVQRIYHADQGEHRR